MVTIVLILILSKITEREGDCHTNDGEITGGRIVKPIAKIFVFLGLLIVQICIYGLPFALSDKFSGFNPIQSGSEIFQVVMLAIWCTLGIFSGVLHREIHSGKFESVTFWGSLKEAWNGKELLNGMLISPILFYAVYALAKQVPNNLIGWLLAYENGFFCNTVYTKVAKRYEH